MLADRNGRTCLSFEYVDTQRERAREKEEGKEKTLNWCRRKEHAEGMVVFVIPQGRRERFFERREKERGVYVHWEKEEAKGQWPWWWDPCQSDSDFSRFLFSFLLFCKNRNFFCLVDAPAYLSLFPAYSLHADVFLASRVDVHVSTSLPVYRETSGLFLSEYPDRFCLDCLLAVFPSDVFSLLLLSR